MGNLKNLIIFSLLFFPSYIFPQNICYVMKTFIRPYKNLTQLIDNSLKDTKFIIKKENFWKIKNCKNVIVFGKESVEIVRQKYYDNNTNFIYAFVLFKNSFKNLKKNESLYFLQPEPRYIFSKIHKLIPNANKWLVFYSGKLQEEYIKLSFIVASKYNIKLIPVFTGNNTNLNKFISQKNYNTFWFIPDNVFSSVDIANYILEKLIFLKKYSIGFNAFFYKSGATISFDIDYEKTAQLILKNLKNKENGYFSFIHNVLINNKNLEYLKNEFE